MTDNMKKWRVRVFSATWLSYFGFYLARKPFSIVKADLDLEFGWDAEALGLLGAIYLLAYTIGQFISGATGDRLGSKQVLLFGMGGTIVANAAMGFSNSFGAFAVLMALNGLFQSTGWSNTVGIMGRWFQRKERGRVMGFWATNYQVGGVAANTLAAYLLGKYGFQYAFFGGSIALLAVWVFVLFNAKNKPSDVGEPELEDDSDIEDESGQGHWSRQVITNVLIMGCFYFFVKFIRYALWSWAPYLLRQNFGLEGDDAGYLSTVFDLAGIAGVIACGFLSDKYFGGKRAKPALGFLLAMIASCIVLYLFGGVSVTFFAIAIGLIGFSLYGPDALMTGAGAIEVGSAKRAALAAGIINGMGSAGAVTQELVLGSVLKNSSVTVVFAILLACSVGATLATIVLVVRGKQGKSSL